MELVANILLVAGALGAGFYCFVLARRLKRFNDLEKGVGGAVAVLSAQVDDLNRSLVAARQTAEGSGAALDDLTHRAETVAQRLELLMASMHDVPLGDPMVAAGSPPDPSVADADSGSRPEREGGPIFVRHNQPRDGAVQ